MADQTSLFIQQRSDEMRRISEAEKNNKRVRFDAWKRIYTKKYGNKVSFGGNEAILTKADGTQVVVGNYKTDKKKTLQENKPKQKPNEEQLLIDKRIAEIDAADKKRLDDARKAENQEIRDEVALDKELNPWGIDNIRRTTGMEVGRSDAQFTKGDGYNLTIPKNIPSDKQDQSGMGKGVEPIGTYKSDTGELDREAWLKKTANSPAAKAFGKGKKADDLRWAAQQNYRKFKRDNNRGRLGIGLFGL